jgi:hypothetical protein
MSYSRTQAQGAASRAKTQMGGQSQKSQSGPEARPPDSKFEPFPVYTITTLMESMARATLDEGFAGRGELILFYGPPKHGKAFLASQFAVSVAVGANWFGRKCAFERFRTVRQNATPHWLARKSLRNRCRGKVTRKIARPRIVPGPGRPTAYDRATADSALEWLASGKSLRSWSAADPSRPHASTNIKWALRNQRQFRRAIPLAVIRHRMWSTAPTSSRSPHDRGSARNPSPLREEPGEDDGKGKPLDTSAPPGTPSWRWPLSADADRIK